MDISQLIFLLRQTFFFVICERLNFYDLILDHYFVHQAIHQRLLQCLVRFAFSRDCLGFTAMNFVKWYELLNRYSPIFIRKCLRMYGLVILILNCDVASSKENEVIITMPSSDGYHLKVMPSIVYLIARNQLDAVFQYYKFFDDYPHPWQVVNGTDPNKVIQEKYQPDGYYYLADLHCRSIRMLKSLLNIPRGY